MQTKNQLIDLEDFIAEVGKLGMPHTVGQLDKIYVLSPGKLRDKDRSSQLPINKAERKKEGQLVVFRAEKDDSRIVWKFTIPNHSVEKFWPDWY